MKDNEIDILRDMVADADSLADDSIRNAIAELTDIRVQQSGFNRDAGSDAIRRAIGHLVDALSGLRQQESLANTLRYRR